MVNEFSQLLATLLNCATAFLTLFLETDRGKCEQHSFRKRFCFDHMLMFIQWRENETIVIESQIRRTPTGSRPGCDPSPEWNLGMAFESPLCRLAIKSSGRGIILIVFEKPIQHIHVTEFAQRFATGAKLDVIIRRGGGGCQKAVRQLSGESCYFG